jgi:hypothetical protein
MRRRDLRCDRARFSAGTSTGHDDALESLLQQPGRHEESPQPTRAPEEVVCRPSGGGVGFGLAAGAEVRWPFALAAAAVAAVAAVAAREDDASTHFSSELRRCRWLKSVSQLQSSVM